MLWMKNSPDKYRDNDFLNRTTQYSDSRTDKFREVSFERSFERRIYHVEGCIRSNNVEIVLTSRENPSERHDISLPLKEGVRLCDEHFRSDFRRMLMAV